ncbi:hypothetical protein M407DRAFT_31959 [Tulasnella calospora MUT 4182]|uniref:Uncharacterized protein n=1 Tax=Tulasnella calospora MUT 4182 TaxID=1051891 RepID=A0A0C3Q5L6_9AGAM|nr:hypothetical protein M407DRAFT_31959 [Tulasnella calospora MUT 4182]
MSSRPRRNAVDYGTPSGQPSLAIFLPRRDALRGTVWDTIFLDELLQDHKRLPNSSRFIQAMNELNDVFTLYTWTFLQ